jgi:ApaG protein
VYTYTVTITNIGYQSSQLLRRHWYITDGWGKVQEVEGEGVIGEQPVLHPGESHTYSSFCPLSTPTGSMHGYYTFVRGAGEEFQAEVGLFALGGDTLLN